MSMTIPGVPAEITQEQRRAAIAALGIDLKVASDIKEVHVAYSAVELVLVARDTEGQHAFRKPGEYAYHTIVVPVAYEE